MRPNDRAETPARSRADSNVQVIYTGNNLAVVGAETFDSYLEAAKDGQPVPLQDVSAVAPVRTAGPWAPPWRPPLSPGIRHLSCNPLDSKQIRARSARRSPRSRGGPPPRPSSDPLYFSMNLRALTLA